MPRSTEFDEQYGPIRLDHELMEDIRAEAKARKMAIADVMRERLAARPWIGKEDCEDGTDPASAES